MVFLDVLAIIFLYYKKHPNRLSKRTLDGIIHNSLLWLIILLNLNHIGIFCFLKHENLGRVPRRAS